MVFLHRIRYFHAFSLQVGGFSASRDWRISSGGFFVSARGVIINIVVQILEVEPPSQACLLAGMRVCAYWSTKYHYLHPGTIVKNTQVPPARILRFRRVKRYSVKVLQGNMVLSEEYSDTTGQDAQLLG
jgi:hypothetical protein